MGDGRGGEAWDWMGWVFLFLSRQLFDSSCGESMSKDVLFMDVLHGLSGLDRLIDGLGGFTLSVEHDFLRGFLSQDL